MINTLYDFASMIPCNRYKALSAAYDMTDETKFKEKVKTEDDGGYKIERESKDEFGNKVKEKHEVKVD